MSARDRDIPKAELVAQLTALGRSVEGNGRAMMQVARQMRSAGLKAQAVDLAARAPLAAPDDREVAVLSRHVLSASVPRWHFPMVHDRERNQAYEAGIRAAVFPGCKVLEIGTGSGLLAMMAARAGAGRVITCEANPAIALAARQIIADNGYADRVTVLARHSTDIDVEADMDGPADVLVSEILSDDLVGEGVVRSHHHAMAHLVKPGAAVVPLRARLRIALAYFADLPEYRLDMHEGFDLTGFNRLQRPGLPLRSNQRGLTLRSEGADLFALDLSRPDLDSASVTLDLTATGDGPVNGLIQWMALDMTGAPGFENKPAPDRMSSWICSFRPLDAPRDMKAGETLAVAGRRSPDEIFAWQA